MKYRARNDTQESRKSVSLRDCLAFFYLDNLVRTRGHGDPDPGKTRTSQIHTLPMTLKGLPRDSLTVASWHQEGCNSESNCSCMDSLELPKSEKHLLLQYTENEQKALRKFQMQVCCSIGFCVEDLKVLVTEYIEFQNDAEQLNKSMHSPSLNVTVLLTTEDLERIEEIERSKVSDIYFETEEAKEELVFDVGAAEDDDVYGYYDDNYFDDGDNCVVSVDIGEDDDGGGGGDDYQIDNGEEEDMPNICENQFIDGMEKLNISALEGEESEYEEKSDQNVCSESFKQPSSVLSIESKDTTESFLFKKYTVPTLLCRHPTPAEGRDDEINLLRDILLDILIKLGRYPEVQNKERILFAPDHKISINLIHLVKTNRRFHQFLPEFPILHLKKSKINNVLQLIKKLELLIF